MSGDVLPEIDREPTKLGPYPGCALCAKRWEEDREFYVRMGYPYMAKERCRVHRNYCLTTRNHDWRSGHGIGNGYEYRDHPVSKQRTAFQTERCVRCHAVRRVSLGKV